MAKNTQKAAKLFLKGTQAMKIENFGIALNMLSQALSYDKDNTDIMIRLAQVQLAIGRAVEARDLLRRCIKRKPNYPDGLLLLSQAYMGLGEIDEMHKTLEKALAWDPRNGPCVHAKVVGHINAGEIELAQQVLNRVGDQGKVHALIEMARIKLLRAQKQHAQGIDRSLKLIDSPDLIDRYKRSSRFELGHLYDAVGEYEKAFEMFQLANGGHIQGKTLHADSIISMWSREMLGGIPESTLDDQRPVFIVGMPRSGTTLCERILDAHPRVTGIGECPLVSHQLLRKSPTSLTGDDVHSYAIEYASMLDERVGTEPERVIDKHMGAERTLGIISKLFPRAKIIHCLRDPIDSCLSSYFQNFGTNVTYSRDLKSLGNHYIAHRRLMQHWSEVLDLAIYENSYEELVSEPEKRSRALVEHIGLEFDDRCLQFHESKKFVSTASSVQVQSPIYQSSKQRWKNYERFIGPLIEALGEYAEL